MEWPLATPFAWPLAYPPFTCPFVRFSFNRVLASRVFGLGVLLPNSSSACKKEKGIEDDFSITRTSDRFAPICSSASLRSVFVCHILWLTVTQAHTHTLSFIDKDSITRTKTRLSLSKSRLFPRPRLCIDGVICLLPWPGHYHLLQSK